MKTLFMFKSENFLAPIGLCTISAVAKKYGHQTYLCETNSENTMQRIADIKPDVICYSSSTGEAKHYFRLNTEIKNEFPQVFTIMGGPHPTFYPEVISEEKGLDALCIGDGEIAFVSLLSALSRKESIDAIPGIVTRNNRNIFTAGELTENLDMLPHPDFSLIYDNTPLGKYPLKSFIASRGCSYDCTYCFNKAWRNIYVGKGKMVRRNSVDYVIDQIKHVQEKWPLSCIKFYDDIFSYTADEWLEEFSKKYKERVNLPFFILTRADLLTEEMVKLLKYAGCRTISMSIESGDQGIRAQMLGRRMSDKQIVNAHRLCDRYGIYTFANCILGLPGTSVGDDIKSVDLAIKAKATWSEFPIFYPYPKTELGRYAIEKGFYKPVYKQMHTSYQYRSLLSCFSDREKNAQMNLSVLGAVAVVFPYFRSLIVRYLIYLPHNPVFTLIYHLAKTHTFRKKIYVTKTNFLSSLHIFLRSLRQEWFRHEDKNG
ncbi:MAG: radical SAM protein [Patescibacteria group bacterium]